MATPAPSASGKLSRRRRSLAAVIGVSAVLAATLLGGAQAATAAPSVSSIANLSNHIKVFTPGMSTAFIQKQVDAVYAQQVDAEQGTGRWSLLFSPGTYGTVDQPLVFQVGYYTEVAGLGASPDDVTINGHVDVYNRCLDDNGTSNCIALDNFWRSVSNLHINAVGGEGCHASAEFWAVSQAAPMRRVHVSGAQLSFMDYCGAGPYYASGGFVADSKVDGPTVNGSQQQFYTRNSSLGGAWSNGVWNQVFSGTPGAPAQTFPQDKSVDPAVGPYTTLATTPVSREKPYLVAGGKYGLSVFVPDARTESTGPSWEGGKEIGRSVPLWKFFIATPSTPISLINIALKYGQNLLLTPGVYNVDRSIRVNRPNTVVLGMGFATLTSANGAIPLVVGDAPGIDIAGLTIDAGPVESPALMTVGAADRSSGYDATGVGAADNPAALQDVFFRVGGPHAGKTKLALQVNADHVIMDDLWIWRADHGQGVGWTENTADTGLEVNGANVTATGLFVEHFQKYNVIWNGEGGKTIFFQNELPYDAPSQEAWMNGDSLGWAAYKVNDNVKTHELWGGGSYIYTNVVPTLHASRGFEVPVTPGVKMHDLTTISLNKAGTIDHVINDIGDPVTPDIQGPSTVTDFSG